MIILCRSVRVRVFRCFRVLFCLALLSGNAIAEPQNTPETLKAAIEDLVKTFGKEYPQGSGFLKELEKPENRSGAGFEALQKKALTANPFVTRHPILFVARNQYPKDHHNTATMFQTGEINTSKYKGRGFLKTIDFGKGGKVAVLLDPGENATPRDPELSFDGKKIIFSMRKNRDDNYHIYEISADGSGLKQLTSAKGVFDIDPLYLPDGGIIFTSSREPKYCMCNRHIMGNLFRMEADGANIHQIGKSTLMEGHSSLMPDGRILYYRWEYVDRNFGDAQGLWVVNPDGSNHAIYWGNNTGSPGAVIDGRIIPGTQLCVCIFGACHDRPWGAMAIIDRSKGVDGIDSVVRTWPPSAAGLVNVNGNFDKFGSARPKYEDPYPLSDPSTGLGGGKYFLVSRKKDKSDQTELCLLDTFGNQIVLHSEEKQGCFDPMPVAPRSKTPAKPVARDYENGVGTFYVQDVYIGTHMDGIKRGEVKYLRVVESPEKRSWTRQAWGGQGQHAPGMNWHDFSSKRVLGTVSVEADGSAHFECPSDRFVYFQLLDENGMMVQSMRSGTIIQSGENQGCVGCHENRVEDTPAPKSVPMALKRPPTKLDGWYGPARDFSYQEEVQPVFDKHCVKCHDFGEKAGKTLNLAGDRALCFNASYTDLWAKKFINCVGAGPARIMPAKSWGSHASKLTKVIMGAHEDHKKISLSREERDRIITWMDINAVYYPTYDSAYPDNPSGRAPITGKDLGRLKQLTKAGFVGSHGARNSAQVSFDRPEKSLCLSALEKGSDSYKEALAIIEQGRKNLKEKPRADMKGFVPCEDHQQRIDKYNARAKIEAGNRKAIREGKKLYDRDLE